MSNWIRRLLPHSCGLAAALIAARKSAAKAPPSEKTREARIKVEAPSSRRVRSSGLHRLSARTRNARIRAAGRGRRPPLRSHGVIGAADRHGGRTVMRALLLAGVSALMITLSGVTVAQQQNSRGKEVTGTVTTVDKQAGKIVVDGQTYQHSQGGGA